MKSKSHYLRVLAGIFLLSITCVTAVPQQRSGGVADQTNDVAFDIKFSPDGKTLAIARGATDPAQQFGRIELWDTDSGLLRRVIQGFDGPVRSISFTPDSKMIVSGSIEYHPEKLQEKATTRSGEVSSEVKWWDVTTGDLKHRTDVSSDHAVSIAVECSPDGKQIAVVQSIVQYSNTNTRRPSTGPRLGPPPDSGFFHFNPFSTSELRLLDSASGELKKKVSINSPGILAYSGDGRLLATISQNQVKIFDANSGKQMGELKDFRGSPNALKFSPDSTSLAVVSTKLDRESSGNLIRIIGRSEVKVFDVKDWTLSAKLNDLGAVHCLSYEPSGRYLLLGGMLNEDEKEAIPALKIWNLQSKAVARYPTGGETYNESVKLLTVAQTGRLLALASGNDSIKLVDTRSWKISKTMDASSVGDKVQRPVGRFLLVVKTILEVAFNDEGTLVTSESDQGEIKQWDQRTGELKFQMVGAEGPTRVSAPLNSRFFSELADGELTLWSFDTHVRRGLELPQQSPAIATAFSRDGLTMVVVTPGKVLLYDTTTDSLSKTFPLPGLQITAVAISNNKETIALATDSGSVSLLAISDGRISQPLPNSGRVVDLSFSPDDRMLATTAGNEINLFDSHSGTLIRTLAKHEAAVNAVAFSSNGRLLASGSDDRTAIIWEIDSGKSKHVLKGHDQTVRAVAFSPDGRFLASGSGNASVVLWDVASGRLNRVLR